MKDIIEQFDNVRHSEDLFRTWQEEVQLRNHLRTYSTGKVNLTFKHISSETLEFLQRAFYWSGRRQDFFDILLANMNDQATCRWINLNPDLACEFLAYVPYYILEKQPDYRQLKFLINIYRKEYQAGFIRIINVLNFGICRELILHTANNELRSLLRRRLGQLQEEQDDLDYGIKPGARSSYSTIYGDKLQLLVKAASGLKSIQHYNPIEPNLNQHFLLSLEAAQSVFEAGLVEDSLATLADVYSTYLDQSRTVQWDEEALLYKSLHGELRRMIPIYALSLNSSAAFSSTLSCYRQWFALVSPDPASMQFLKFYETILEGNLNPAISLIPELHLKAVVINNYRPGDSFIVSVINWCQNPMNDPLIKMHMAAQERMRALPHEAFIILEFLRLALKYHPGCSKGLNLLKDYEELWKWFPSPLFLNEELVQELSPYSDPAARRQTEKTVRHLAGTATSGKTYSEPYLQQSNNLMDLFARIIMEVQ